MEISDERYVSLTTFRRNGEAVSSPVWIAALAGGRAGFTTDPGSGKVKRIANNGRVELRPCNARGVVAEGVAPTHATAEVVTGGSDAYREVERAVGAKYGFQFRMLRIGSKLKGLIGRGGAGEAGIVITLG